MDWESLAKNFGMPGLMLGAMIYGWRLWVASNERVQLEKVKVEDKKADAMASALTSLATALTSLAGEMRMHHTADLQSHQSMSNDVAELHGKLDQALIDRTPVRGVPTGESTAGYYPPARPKTGGR